MQRNKNKTESIKLASLMFMIGRLIRDEVHKKQRQMACSVLHFQTLRYVKEHNRPLMRDVAAYLLITPPAATLLIDALVKDKLLTRIIDHKDRRVVRLVITKRGSAILTRGMRDVTQKLASVFSVLNDKEKHGLVGLLEKVTGHQ